MKPGISRSSLSIHDILASRNPRKSRCLVLSVRLRYRLAYHGARVLGPNTAGAVTPGECFAGFMPAFNERIFKKGSIGVISRSGSLGVLFCLNVVQAGFGESAFLGIGGDPIIGTTQRDALAALDTFPGTEAIVMVGEIGGSMEEEAAVYAKAMTKPVVAFIAGGAAPEGKKMGHAGAIVMATREPMLPSARRWKPRGSPCSIRPPTWG